MLRCVERLLRIRSANDKLSTDMEDSSFGEQSQTIDNQLISSLIFRKHFSQQCYGICDTALTP